MIYVFMYNVNDIESLQDYAFIRGQLMTFEQMEQYKIYEDEQYVCYDTSDLFYTDLRQYVESMVSQRSDIYFDEQIWERIQNIYNYYRENMGTLLGYKTDMDESAVYEDPYRLHVTVSSNSEEDLAKLKAFDTAGGALEIEYSNSMPVLE